MMRKIARVSLAVFLTISCFFIGDLSASATTKVDGTGKVTWTTVPSLSSDGRTLAPGGVIAASTSGQVGQDSETAICRPAALTSAEIATLNTSGGPVSYITYDSSLTGRTNATVTPSTGNATNTTTWKDWSGTQSSLTLPSFTCPTGTQLILIQAYVNYSNDVGEDAFWYPGSTDLPNDGVCAAGKLDQAQASWISGSFRLSARWQGTSAYNPPKFKIYKGADTTGPIFNGSTTAVSGATNYFETGATAIAQPSSSITTVRVGVYTDAETVGCFLSVLFSTTQVIIPGPLDTTLPTDTSSCGFSLNPISYLRCLFIPTSAFTQWQTTADTAKTHAPTSFIINSTTYFTSLLGGLTSTGSSSGDELGFGNDASCIRPGSLCYNGIDGPSGTDVNFNPIEAAGNQVQDGLTANNTATKAYWYGLYVAFWLPAFWFIWTRIGASFGSRDGEAA